MNKIDCRSPSSFNAYFGDKLGIGFGIISFQNHSMFVQT